MTFTGDHASQGPKFLKTNSERWLWFSMVAAVLAMAGNLTGLLIPSVYADLTPAFLPQAFAQDIANLVLVSPAMLVLAFLSLRSSLRSYLLWLGVVSFTVYNYVIYTFSIPFGALFLLWVAVLGLSIYTLIGGISTANHAMIESSFKKSMRVKVMAWVLIVVGTFFSFVWLSEDIPALLAGTAPASVTDMGVPTNPVHILDLAFFLPAVITTGIMLLRGDPLGYTVAPGLMVFLILTGVPILLTPLVQKVIGQTPAWDVALPIGTMTLFLVVILSWVVASIHGG